MRLARVLELNDSLRGTAHQTGVVDHARRALDIGDEQHNIDEKEDDENRPLGIILCSDKNEEQIELLELGESDIHIAKYLTVLPPKDKFEKRLHRAIENAKQKYKIKNYKEDELI
mgnify:CR=1 FL=1